MHNFQADSTPGILYSIEVVIINLCELGSAKFVNFMRSVFQLLRLGL